MAKVGTLNSRLDEFNSKMGNEVSTMNSSIVTVQESLKNSSNKYTEVSNSISGSWSTSNSKTTLQSLELIIESIEQIVGASETFKSALEACGSLKEIVDKIIADIEEGKGLKEAETVDVFDDKGNKTGTEYHENDQKRIDKLITEVTDYNEKGVKLLDSIINMLDSIKITKIETSSGASKGLYTAFAAPKGTSVSNENYIAEQLQSSGYSDAAICGILSNIKYESKFNPGSIGDGGTSHGICQWHDNKSGSVTRWTEARDWCEENGYNPETIEGQTAYLIYDITYGERSRMGRVLRGEEAAKDGTVVKDDAQGAYDAGFQFSKTYEQPAGGEVSAKKRGLLSKEQYLVSQIAKI